MWRIDDTSAVPIYAQIAQAIRLQVARGTLRPGDRLPTVRQLAIELKVNANTVARVFQQLERDGVLETRRGQGSFIAHTPSPAPAAAAAAQARLDELCRTFAVRCQSEGFGLRAVRRALARLQVEQDPKGRQP